MENTLGFRSIVPLAAVALTLSLGACAEQSGPPVSTPMQLGSATLAPRGYLQFCLRRPDQCGLHTPVAEIQHDALQAALNREEWRNVLSLGDRDQSQAAPKASPAETTTVSAPIAETEFTDSPAAQGVVKLDVQPIDVPPAIDADETPVPVHLVALSIAAVPTTPPITPGAPKLEELFQDVHRALAPTLVHFNPALWAHLERVNIDINLRIRPRTDQEAFGLDDYWTLPLDVGGRGEGNCKHYALEKRRELIEGGMSEDALSLAIVRTPRGETHAVLIVATDRGDFVMDNLTPAIVGWRQAGYTWLSRQTPGDPLRWAAVDGVRSGA